MYTIRSLRLGEIYIPHGDSTFRDPVHTWLVLGEGLNILVDSGMPHWEENLRRLKVGGHGGGHDALRKTLAAEGLTPDAIDYVVLTHLHFDHAYNLDLFPNACVLVQRDELFHAIDPTPTQRIYYFKETIIELVNRKRPSQLRLLDGDETPFPGFQLLKVPAHTPGMQVPIVTTERGKVALVSDLGDHYRYWYPADPRASRRPIRYLQGSFLPGPIRSESERDWCAQMKRVLDHADIVVPAHDFRIPQRMPEEWFAIPDSNDGDLADTPPPEAVEDQTAAPGAGQTEERSA